MQRWQQVRKSRCRYSCLGDSVTQVRENIVFVVSRAVDINVCFSPLFKKHLFFTTMCARRRCYLTTHICCLWSTHTHTHTHIYVHNIRIHTLYVYIHLYIHICVYNCLNVLPYCCSLWSALLKEVGLRASYITSRKRPLVLSISAARRCVYTYVYF